MDIRVLEYFLAVAREQTISGAAQALHMTQPPLSKQLKELEEELGKQLLIRGARRVTLTREGMLLRERAQQIVELMEKTREIEETLELERKVVPAELTYIRELLTGPWDTTRYEIVPPYGIVGRYGENV